MKLKYLLIVCLFFAVGRSSFASHIMGGEITWTCLGGGSYQFNLVLYRDCNGLEIVDPSFDLSVWGHPTVTAITCNLLSTTDLSPECTQVPGGPAELDCGTGTGGGNGPGALQKFHYQSGPVLLAGVPPANGWAFTFSSFSRNWGLTNLVDPFSYGITLSAIMYAVDGNSAAPCIDSSPQFEQDPYMLMCAGTDFQYNPGAYDPDNDSLVYSWGVPLDQLVSGSFAPPLNPAPVPFVAGYSNSNPTPDASFAPGNVPATMDTESGVISFLSNTTGNFGLVQKIDSYRNGERISTIHRELQMIVIPCPGYVNTPPVITPPFGGTSFAATFFAGDLVNFNIAISDVEVLQNGTPQLVTLNPSGNYFGTNFTDPNSGCEYSPCATLSTAPIIQGVQGVNTTFNWQTTCDHLKDANGVQQEEVTYYFVLNAQDDYCAVPGRAFETVAITIKNKEMLNPVDLQCADVLANGDVTLTWQPTTDPSGVSFVQYEVWSQEDGLLATIPAIATSSYTVVGAGADVMSKHYYIVTKFGCGGNNAESSDVLATMFMQLTDLSDGRVSLTWNDMQNPLNGGDAPVYEIYREFPAGVWTLRGTMPYGGTNFFIDTVDVCTAFQTYEIRVQNAAGCVSTSNDKGMLLQDIINPYIPVMDWVSIDTTTGFVDISWNVNQSEDTYGYIIYALVGGFWEPIDTVFGINNTTYSYTGTSSDIHPETFRIAAFDSCLTSSFPQTYQTSALSLPHTTIFLENSFEVCEKRVNLSWTPYMGWPEGVQRYEVIVSVAGSPYEVIASLGSTATSYVHNSLVYDANYCYYIRAVSNHDSISYSNGNCRFTQSPSEANFHYLASASYNLADEVELLCYTDGTASVQSYEVEVKGPLDNDFSLLTSLTPNGTDFIQYSDATVLPAQGAYQYRISLIDSCGNVGFVTDVSRTIFLEVQTDHVSMLNTLSWSSYVGFDGMIAEYRIYRGINGVFDATPIAITLPGVRSYEDDVSAYFESEGQFCYRVEAIENLNSYNLAETAFSNTVCATIDPVVYIPNAFVVNGKNNPKFLPIVSLYDFDSYLLTIYDRWGGVVFQTEDRNLGWDGYTTNGDIKPQGTYVYHLVFYDREGKEYNYRGFVTMLIDQP